MLNHLMVLLYRNSKREIFAQCSHCVLPQCYSQNQEHHPTKKTESCMTHSGPWKKKGEEKTDHEAHTGNKKDNDEGSHIVTFACLPSIAKQFYDHPRYKNAPEDHRSDPILIDQWQH